MTRSFGRRTLAAAFGTMMAQRAFGQAATSPSATPTGSASVPRTMAGQFADYAAAARYEQLDAATIEAVKGHLIDALGCAVAALHEPPVQAVRTLATSIAGTQSTLIGTRRKTAVDWAAFANGAAIRHFDLNDVYAARDTGHPSDNVSACLAVAEAENRSGRDLVLAIALAYEVDCRLLDAAELINRGWDHPCYSLAAAGLAAGKLMALSPAELEQAVNLAINSHLALGQTRVQVMSNWKGMADADAARDGVFAALLARAGITGPAPIFEGTDGFFKQVSGPFAIDFAAFGGRSGRYKVNDCTIKYYPAQAQTQTAIPAAIHLARQVGDLRRIRRIDVLTTKAGFESTAGEPGKWAPETSETADHSLPYIVVRAMLDGNISTASYRPEALRDPRARELLAKVGVHEDPALTAMFPRLVPNKLTVTLDDGRVLSEQVDDLPGFVTRPMRRPDYEAKFRSNAEGKLDGARVDSFLSQAWTLENAASVTPLLESLAIQT